MSDQPHTALSVRRFYISGKVQGVFFRACTKREANKLAIRGHAVNLADGRVEVLAVGAPESVERLLAWLNEGPPRARVSGVEEIALSGDVAEKIALETSGFSCR